MDSEAHAGDPRLPGGASVPPRQPTGSAPALDAPEANGLAAASARARAADSARAGPKPADRKRRRVDLASVLSVTGRTLITLGLLVLGFVGFELIGTNVAESRDQSTLREELAEEVSVPALPETPAELPTSAPIPNAAPPIAPPAGSAIARIKIPAIGVDKTVVEGVNLSDLRRGPGHYKGTPLPGQPGNSAIAGHRTTYGAPFYRLDQLVKGNEILVSTAQGAFRYEVREKPRIVRPNQVDVLDPTPTSQLTLTTCNPRFSAAQRLVVVADLIGPAAAAPPPAPAPDPTQAPAPMVTTPAADPERDPPVAAPEIDEAPDTQMVAGASGDPAERVPSALWGIVTLAVGLAGAVLGRLWRRWPAWILFAAPFLASLWTFYSHLAKAIPS